MAAPRPGDAQGEEIRSTPPPDGRPLHIAVIGASAPTEVQARAAHEAGAILGAAGAIVITGGGGGVMAGASRGAAQAGAIVVGLLPGADPGNANPWVQVALPTGMGELRNGLIVRAADAVLAIGGAYGTLSEIALALSAGVPVVGWDTWPIEGVQTADDPARAARLALEHGERRRRP